MKFKRFIWDDRERWDNFCLKNDLAWFWHTSFRLQHALNCSNSTKSENHSFFVEDAGEIMAIVPLTVDIVEKEIIQRLEQIIEMNYGGMMVPAPVVNQNLKEERKTKLLKMIFSEIDKIAHANNVQRLVMRIPLSLSYCKKYPYYNFLMKYGFQDISLNTSVVDLEPDEDKILNAMSENHKRAILKGKKFLQIKMFDQANIKEEILESFKAFYIRIANNTAFPEERFRLLFYYLKHNMAVMAQALYKGDVIGYVVAIFYKNDAYYLMGANENNFVHCPIAHIIHWEIMKYLKRKGISHYEIGLQQFGSSISEQPSAKHISISRFKRGFGGVILPHFIGEKFYSKTHYKEVWEHRIKNYLKTANELK